MLNESLMTNNIIDDTTKIVFAAGLVAKELHNGQLDKGGHNYFESHLLKVGLSGIDWKEQVVGFLHDAAEDCDVTVDDVIEILKAKVLELANNTKENIQNEVWWEEWMKDIIQYPHETNHQICAEDYNELKTVLNLLNHHRVSSRKEYINQISENSLALRVKLHDLENNLDLSRIPNPTEKDYARIKRYQNEHQQLSEALSLKSSSM